MTSTISSGYRTAPLRKVAPSSSERPIRLVLFDVFDTLCTPRIPIHEQYYDEAVKGGLTSKEVSPASVRAGFRPAFKELDAAFPLYGKHAEPPISPEAWWTKIIYQTLLHAGATQSELDAKIGIIAPALSKRFESDAGYHNFPETIATLHALRDLGVKTSIVSNADPRIRMSIHFTAVEIKVKTLDSLAILPLLSHPPTLSWDAEAGKPSPIIYEKACATCAEDVGEGVIMVGDELKADFRGAQAAGIEGRLIRRPGEWSDGAARKAKEDLGDVNVIKSLEEILEEVKERNRAHS